MKIMALLRRLFHQEDHVQTQPSEVIKCENDECRTEASRLRHQQREETRRRIENLDREISILRREGH